MSATVSTLPASTQSTTASSASAPASRAFSARRFSLVGLATVIAATVANSLVYYLGSTIVAYDPDFIVLADVYGAIFFTVVAAVGAVGVYAALLRLTGRRAALIFTVISAIVFVVTLIPDFTYIPTVDGSTPEQTAILVLMHIVAAAVIVRMLTTQRVAESRTGERHR
ncbi:MAG TPA: DUF6069 family protein [Chloroflexota bacterium]|jgi:hypothetical protein|nr:DUF6069 family protein [Chloroflexota bacterium]